MSARVLLALLLGLVASACATRPIGLRRGAVEDAVSDRLAERGWTDDHDAGDAALEARLADGLAVEEAVGIALVHSPELAAVYEDLAIAEADLVQAGLLANPVFDGEVKLVEAGGGEVIEMVLVQPLVDLILMPRRRQMAARELARVETRVTAAAIDLAGRVRRAHHAVVGASQRVEMLEAAVRATRASAEAAAALHAAGNVTALDRERELVLYEQIRVDLADAQLAELDARERLNELMGLWGRHTAWEAPGRLPDPPVLPWTRQEVEQLAVARSLDLRARRQALEALAARLGLEQVGAVVRDVGAGVAAEREPDGTWATGPAIEIEIPLFDHGQAAVPRAAAQVRQACHRYEAEAVRVRARARVAYARAEATLRVVQHHREVLLPLRQSILERTQAQVNAMQLGVFQLLLARRQQVETGRAAIAALEACWRARSALDQIVAGVLPEAGAMAAMPQEGATPSGGGEGGGH